MPNHMQKIKFTTMFILEIQLTPFFRSLWILNQIQENNFIAQLILDMKPTHYMAYFGYAYTCLTTPTLDD